MTKVILAVMVAILLVGMVTAPTTAAQNKAMEGLAISGLGAGFQGSAVASYFVG